MFEHATSALATLWLQSGFVAACGCLTARFVQTRSATLAATILRATWLGVALCFMLSATSFHSHSQRALWKVALPTTSISTIATPISPQSPTVQAPENSRESSSVADSSATSSTRSSVKIDETPLLPAQESSLVAENPSLKPSLFYGIFLISWLTISALLLSWTGFCAWQMRRVVRSSTRIGDGAWRDELRDLSTLLQVREPILLRSGMASSPFLTGLLRPCIVLPRGEFGASQRFVLLHELTHLQRRDLWWNSAARIFCAVLWTQPLLWILQRASESLSEEVCDESVVNRGESARQYAQCLLDLAESWRPTRGERIIGASVVPLRSSLARRVQNILDESRRRTMIVSRRARWIIGVSTLGVVTAALSLVAVQANPKVSAKVATKSSTRNVDLSSPESTVRSFANALDTRNLDAAIKCVEGAAPLVNPELQKSIGKSNIPRSSIPKLKPSIAVSDFETQRSGETATVTFRATFSGRNYRTTMLLRQSKGVWKIVSQVRGRPPRNVLTRTAYFLSPYFKPELTTWAKNRGKASIIGRVVDDKGKPVSGALVKTNADIHSQFHNEMGVMFTELFNIEPRISRIISQEVKSASDGTFRINGLTSAKYLLYTWQPKSSAKRVPQFISAGSINVVAREGSSTRSPDLKMTRGGLVSVRVLNHKTRQPLQGVSIMLNAQLNDRTTYGVSEVTDDNGRCVLTSPVGRARVMLYFDFFKKQNGMYVLVNDMPYVPVTKAGAKLKRPVYPRIPTEGQVIQVRRDKPNEVFFELQRYIPAKKTPAS